MASQVAVIDYPTGVNGNSRVYNTIRGELTRGTDRVMFVCGRSLVKSIREANTPPALARISTFLLPGPLPELDEHCLVVLEQVHREHRERMHRQLRESECKVIFLNCAV